MEEKETKLKRRLELEREARLNESDIKKEEAMLEVRKKIIAKQVIILNLSNSLAYSMLCIS